MMRRLLLFGLVCAVAGLSLRQCATARTAFFYAPDGYVERANALIAAGMVDFDCERNRIVVRLEEGTPDYQWYQTSYLQADIRAFNDEQQSYADLFLLEGCELRGVNPYSHVVRLPRTSDRDFEWHGELRFAAGDAAGTLIGERQMIGLLNPLRPVAGGDAKPIPVGGSGRPAPSTESFTEAVVANFFYPPSAAREASDVYPVGPTAVLRDRRDRAIVETHPVFLMGRRVPPGRVASLVDGYWIQFVERQARAERRSTYLYTDRDVSRIISAANQRNNGWVRSTRPNTIGFAEDLIGGLDDVVNRTGASAIAGLNIELTLDRSLHEELTRKLRAAVLPRANRKNRPVRAAVTMMDAFSGDVLALASYPSVPEDLARFAYLSTGQRRRLSSNQNLLNHPIGSAGKPFWAAAIVNEYPFLASFSIPAHAADLKYPRAAGRQLSDGFEVHNHLGGPLGMERFLAESSNKYIVDLATVGLGIRTDCAGRERIASISDCLAFHPTMLEDLDRFNIGGLTANRVPTLGRHERSEPELLFDLDQNPIFSQLQHLTGARTYSESAPEPRTDTAPANELFGRWYQTARFHPYPWRRLVAWLGQSAADPTTESIMHARLAAVSPEGVNLAVNTANGLRSEWINLLLGGGTALWNNVQLAESLSRLVTGRDVRSEMVGHLKENDRENNPPAAEPAPLLANPRLREDARRVVLLGMQSVLSSPAGTAHDIQTADFSLFSELSAEFPEHDIWLFGKTGTPRIEVQGLMPLFRALRDMFSGRGIEIDANSQRITLTTAGRSMLAKFGQDLREDVAGYLDDMNDSREDYRVGSNRAARSPLVVNGNRLELNEDIPRTGRFTIASKGAVFLLSVLMTPKAAGRGPVGDSPVGMDAAAAERLRRIPLARDLDPRNSVGITVAVYLEDVPSTSKEAVLFIREIRDEFVSALRSRTAVR